ncbi:MAG: tetratricopeptide repeat protein [Planctomycetota bacterium]
MAHHARARALAMALVDAGRRGGWTVVLRSLGDVGECKGELAAAVALDPLNLDARDEELAIYLYAPWPIGGAAKARECIEALAALDPCAASCGARRRLDKEDRTADALARVEALAARSDLTPEDRARVALSRGQLLQTLDRFQDAAAVYAALGTGPRTTTWYLAVHERARCCQRGGFELEAAIELLDEFIAGAPVGDFMPELSSAWYRKGLCLRDLGRRDEARLAFEATLALDPDHDRARDELRAR